MPACLQAASGISSQDNRGALAPFFCLLRRCPGLHDVPTVFVGKSVHILFIAGSNRHDSDVQQG